MNKLGSQGGGTKAPFYGNVGARQAMKIANVYKLGDALTNAAFCVQVEIDAMVLVIWSACGDSRTSRDEKVRPAGQKSWFAWQSASKADAGKELNNRVMDSLRTLQDGPVSIINKTRPCGIHFTK